MTGYTQTAQQRPSCPDSLAKEQILYGTCPGLSVWYRFRVNTLELGLARPLGPPHSPITVASHFLCFWSFLLTLGRPQLHLAPTSPASPDLEGLGVGLAA